MKDIQGKGKFYPQQQSEITGAKKRNILSQTCRIVYPVPKRTPEEYELLLETGEYYPLTLEELVKLSRELKESEISVLFYLRTMNYEGKPLTVPVAKIASDLELHPHTVNNALKVLSQKELLPEWCKNNFTFRDSQNNIETKIRDRMKEELGGAVEVVTPVGRIDLLTATEIIEIKRINDWKEALGQLLAYSPSFPQHTKRIHLFGKSDLAKLTAARTTCKEFNITVTFEEV